MKPPRKFWIALFAACLAAMTLVVLHFRASPATPTAYHPQFKHRPAVIAHADESGVALWPGNTFPFLMSAATAGADVLEMDVHMTRDGHVVLMHDDTVDRTTNGSGPLRNMSLAELHALEVAANWTRDGINFPLRGQGTRVPTLDEVLQRFPHIPLNIEIKQESPDMTLAVCRLIRQHKRQPSVIVASFSDAVLQAFRAGCPEVATAASADEVQRFVFLGFSFLEQIVSPDYQALQVPIASSEIRIVRPRFVSAAHRKNLSVDVWTVNDPAEMQKLIDMNVDGIMTDRPDILIELLGHQSISKSP